MGEAVLEEALRVHRESVRLVVRSYRAVVEVCRATGEANPYASERTSAFSAMAREYALVELASGRGTRELAEELGVSQATVQQWRHRARRQNATGHSIEKEG